MGFIEQNLTNNEKIVHKGHLHWFAYASGLALIAVLWAVAMVIIAFNVPEFWVFAVVTLLALLIGYIYVWLVSKNTEYYITNKRLIVKKGIVQRNTSEIRLVKCEDGGAEYARASVQLRYHQNHHGRGGQHLSVYCQSDPLPHNAE